MNKYILLTVTLAAAFCSASAQTFKYNDIYYTVLSSRDMTVKTAEGTGPNASQNQNVGGAVVLPEKVYDASNNEYTLTEIGRFSFGGNSVLTSVTMPNTVTAISQGAFYNCTALTEATLSEMITTLGRDMFYSTRVESINIPPLITSIPEQAFMNMISLQRIYIPDNVTSLGNGAFSSCNSARSIIIGNGVRTIGESAFHQCSNAESLVIGKSVTTIGNNAFVNCGSLKKIISLNATPPTVTPNGVGSYYAFNLEGDGFGYPVYVPSGSESAYKAKNGWRKFPTFSAFNEGALPDGEMVQKNMIKAVEEVVELSEYLDNMTMAYCTTTNSDVASVDVNGKITTRRLGEAQIRAIDVNNAVVADVSVMVCPTIDIVYPEQSVIRQYGLPDAPVDVTFNHSDRWIVNSVNHDGTDVTDKLDGDGRYVSETPVKANSVITLAMQEKPEDNPTGVTMTDVDKNNVRMLVQGMTLNIVGADTNDRIRISALNGTVLYNGMEKTYLFSTSGVYLITVTDSVSGKDSNYKIVIL